MNGLLLALMTVLLVGVTIAKPQGHPNNCDFWCKDNLSRYTCCDKLQACPGDIRKPGDCYRKAVPLPYSSGYQFNSGPSRCSDDSFCGPGAICCPDNCIGHNVCKNL